MTELDDPIMLFGGLLATTLNAVLLLQVILYFGNKGAKTKKE
jgi:mannose-P-dolichol utilization defect protein 1